MQHFKLIEEPIGREAVSLWSDVGLELQKKAKVLN